jgi:lipopolysaccharide biosynthesis regulator YciM
VVAHYYCELAEKSLQSGDHLKFSQYIEQAFKHDKNCVRASIMIANKEKRAKNYAQAIKYYGQVINQDAEYLPKIIEPLKECYAKVGREKEMSTFLDATLQKYNGITPVLYKAEEILMEEGERPAIDFMVQQIKNKPSVRGLQWLVELSLSKSDGKAQENLVILRDLMKTLLNNKPVYECHHCGFTGKSMHWQCPGCKHWNSIKPIKGVVAE